MKWSRFVEPTFWAVWAIGFGGAAFWVVVGSIGYFGRNGWLPSDGAGWVQAIGSIAAIVAAFMIGNQQNRRQEKMQEDDRRRRSRAMYAVVKHSYQTVSNVTFFLANGISPDLFRANWAVLFGQSMESSYQSLLQIPPHELGSDDLVIAYNGLVGSLGTVRSIIAAALVADAFRDSEIKYMADEVLTQYRIIKHNWSLFEAASVSV
ncbi:hypothetical protein [Pseudomonas helleri]|uniref:hypothetical protein n=1 Tax=Pseudomonas helleri TaxID=1608996 RepID=UPI003FCFFDB5